MKFSNNKLTLAAAIATVAFTGLNTSNALAQSGQELGIEEIVVTARKRSESLQEVPLAVSVATEDQLARDQIYSVIDLARTTPALEVLPTFGGETNGGGRIRGIGTALFAQSVSPSVAYVIDQVPVGNTSFPSLFDVVQSEVLRGPQGTLFGQGASAGVINLTTKKPDFEEFSGTVGGDFAPEDSLGSESTLYTLRGAVNIPFSDIAALRVSGLYREDSGLQTNIITGNDTREKLSNLRARLLIEPSDTLSLDFKVETSSTDIRNRAFAIFGDGTTGDRRQRFIDECGFDPQSADGDYAEIFCIEEDDDIEWNANSVSAVVDWDISDSLSLTSVTAHRTLVEDLATVNFSRTVGVAARDANLENSGAQTTQELRFSYTADNFDLLFGAFYQKFVFEKRPLDSNIPFGDPNNITGFAVCNATGFCPAPPVFVQDDTENETIALFADTSINVSDTVTVFGGLRYTDFENETVAGAPNTLNVRGDSGTSAETNVSGRIGASFAPSDNVTMFGSFSTGYKPSAIVSTETQGLLPVEEELSTALEFGVKSSVGRFNLEGNLFYMEVDGYQVQSNVGFEGQLISLPNNADVESYGLELTLYGNLTDNISINTGYIYNPATYDNLIGDDEMNLDGQQIVAAPEHKFSLSGEFSTEVGSSMEFFLNTNLVAKSEVLTTQRDPSRFTNDSLINIGGATGLRSSSGLWRASLWARNITGERESLVQFADPAPGSDSIRHWPYAGITTRLVGFSFDVNF